MTISKQIKERFGTLKHFAKVAGINPDSLSVILCGGGKSTPCTAALIKYGFIKSEEDLKKRN